MYTWNNNNGIQKRVELLRKKSVEDVFEEHWILTDDSVAAQYVSLF